MANNAAEIGRRRVGPLYRIHFTSSRRERLFVSSVSFFIGFGIIRLVTHSIRASVGPFQNVSAGGVHVHHLVFGIALLLLTGYLWLLQIGTGSSGPQSWTSNVTAAMYGLAGALTLDEFALWLNLRDVYWERQGRQSVDAVIFFGALLSIGVWGGPFLHAVGKEFLRVFTGRSN